MWWSGRMWAEVEWTPTASRAVHEEERDEG
jgi:hypothetical protein